jgi:hypothetical protein
MTAGEAVYSVLTGDAGVSAIVGNRIFPGVIPEGSLLPVIVYSVISDVPENSLTGSVATRAVNARVQVDCYARPTSAGGGGYAQVQALAAAVDSALASQSSQTISAWREISRDLFDNETQYHRVSMDFSLWL